jgi:amino acid adenylation domain-containing protein
MTSNLPSKIPTRDRTSPPSSRATDENQTIATPEVFVLPTSFAQQRLWYVSQWQGSTAAYTISQAKRWQGILDNEALEKAVQAIAQRHESLRTHFEFIDQAPMQVIVSTLQVTLPVVDLTTTADSESEKWSQAIAQIHHESKQPFDLTQSPLWRLKLFRLTEQDHILFVSIHHSITDGWSVGIFWQELMLYYQAFQTGQLPHLPPLPIQYADYTLWQQAWVQQERYQIELTYWQQQLGGELPILQFPHSRPRPPIQTFAGRTAFKKLPAELTTALKSCSQRFGSTLFMTLLTVFQILLYRYSGQEDIIVGTPIAGRNRPELESLIGCFVNTLPIRANLSGNPSFRELLDRIRTVTLAAYDHAQTPLEKLVEELNPIRDASRSPFFQVLFVLQNIPRSEPRLLGLKSHPIPIERDTAKFDLTLEIWQRDQELIAELEYNTDLFDAATIAQLLNHYQVLLTGIVANPEQSIDQLPLLTPAEHQQFLDWNATTTDYPRDRTLHQLFETQVKESPQAIAIQSQSQSLTYLELDQQANRLAQYLQAIGIRSGMRVGLCIDRSIRSNKLDSLVDLVLGVLGILKAGAAYVPLDPSYPQARLTFMIQDAALSILLTQSHLVPQLHLICKQISEPSILTIGLDQDWKTSDRLHPNLSLPEPSTEAIAYVMYTSGSTGQPKGVVVPHRAVTRLVCKTNYIQWQSSDRIAQAANISFDAATFEIWGALLNGATLVSIPEAILLTPIDFANYLQTEAIHILFLTTALFHQIAHAVPQAFASLRYLLIGGEALDPHAARLVLDHGKPQHLINVYGPTENTTFSAYYEIHTVADPETTIPIGKAIANTQLHILDHHLQPVPIGIPGELYLSGDGLAIGYLNRPDLTAEKFIPHSPTSPLTLYKTGDFARYRPDGNIEYLGRQDNQVKIRGFRIELGEIEVVLGQHPAVQQAIVMMERVGEASLSENRTEPSKGQSLVAYLLLHPTTTLSLTKLQQFAREKLPDFMIPTALCLLDAFPLTPNGKVDRQSLQHADTSHNISPSVRAVYRDPIEYQLLEIWKEVLGHSTIAITDNFFEIGGHSLLAVRLLTQVEKIFAQSLPLAAIFQNQTIEQLANTLRQDQYAIPAQSDDVQPEHWSYQAAIVEFQKGEQNPPLICLPGVFGSFFYCYGLARHMNSRQPIYAIREPVYYGKKVGFSSVEDLATYYVQTIQSFQPHGPYFLAGYSFGGLVVYEVAQQLWALGQEVRLLALLEPTRPAAPIARWYFQTLAPDATELHTLWYYMGLLGAGRSAKLKTALKAFIAYRIFRQPEWMSDPLIAKTNLSEEQQYLYQYFSTAMRALERYIPQFYPGSLNLFLSHHICQNPRFHQPWQRLTQQNFTVYPIAGHHLTIGNEPHAKMLANQLQHCFDRCQTRSQTHENF